MNACPAVPYEWTPTEVGRLCESESSKIISRAAFRRALAAGRRFRLLVSDGYHKYNGQVRTVSSVNERALVWDSGAILNFIKGDECRVIPGVGWAIRPTCNSTWFLYIPVGG